MALQSQPLGHGVGLRSVHYGEWLAGGPQVDWLEATTENFLQDGGRPLAVLEAVRRDRPIALHGVSLSLGASDPLNDALVKKLQALDERFQPAWISDHLCWGSLRGRYAHDLLPLPFTEEALDVVVARVKAVQEKLGRQILVENVSSYVQYAASALTEWEFLAELAQRADCGVLLDVNNIFVSSVNHGFDARAFLDGIPADRVGYFHLAGHKDCGTHLLDTHDAPVPDPVWALYQDAVRRFGPLATLIEWDEHVPELPRLLEEAERARRHAQRAVPKGIVEARS
ncbi:MAG: DUF692 domain-containing protein [Deltaproteobacteria bacterium]|nr:DUF692 domain-containing protein [Deltaproteobacteria bacterium]